jgi:hypothetical protein
MDKRLKPLEDGLSAIFSFIGKVFKAIGNQFKTQSSN